MDKMKEQVTQFFVNYEDANRSSDMQAIGDMYAGTFMFGGPASVHAVQREDFLTHVPKMKAYFSSLGLIESELSSVEVNQISSRYLLASVEWRIRTQIATGKTLVKAKATYVLARENDDKLSIIFQIDHQDLATVIRGQQKNG